jgi:hypothetical protein
MPFDCIQMWNPDAVVRDEFWKPQIFIPHISKFLSCLVADSEMLKCLIQIQTLYRPGRCWVWLQLAETFSDKPAISFSANPGSGNLLKWGTLLSCSGVLSTIQYVRYLCETHQNSMDISGVSHMYLTYLLACMCIRNANFTKYI